jgi:T5SS/PEP-CTERM-associated repeat protein/autotransporter-associated beta strand protein
MLHRFHFNPTMILAATLAVSICGHLNATVTAEGDVSPADSSTWSASTHVYLGEDSLGTVSITGGETITTDNLYIGYWTGQGEMSISGSGTTVVSDSVSVAKYEGTSGNLDISNGASLTCNYFRVAEYANTTGEVTVTGSGASINVNQGTYIGDGGYGEATFSNGADLNASKTVYVGSDTDTTGILTLSGSGTSLTIGDGYDLRIGKIYGQGVGRVYVSGGATISSGWQIDVEQSSLLSIQVTGNGVVSNQDSSYAGATFINEGTVRLTAAPGLGTGVYTPILAKDGFTGSGDYLAFGGVWENNQFIVGNPLQATLDNQLTIDLSEDQRIQLADSFFASFTPTAGSTSVDFTVSDPTEESLTQLNTVSGGASVQGSYDFTVSGLPGGNNVLLSFEVDPGLTNEDIKIWHDSGSGWELFTPDDLTVANGFASFSVSGFSSYAVTGVALIPEPTTMALFVIAVGGLLSRRPRRR